MDPKEKLQKALLAARAIAEAAEKASRDFTAEERQQIQGYLDEAKTAREAIKQAEGDQALRKQILDLGGGIDLRERQDLGEPLAPGKGKTLGEQFTEAPAFKNWLKQFPNGRIPDSAKGLISPPIGFKTLITGSSDTSAGAFVQSDIVNIYEPLGRRPLTLLDLISRRTTNSDTIEGVVRQTAKVTQAVPVAEANVTTYNRGTGEVEGAKPEGTMTFEKVTATVKTIAVWIPATKRALSDAAQLRGLIDQELRADVNEDLEDEVFGGDGTGEHLLGIDHTSGVLTQAWDTDLFTTARKAVTALDDVFTRQTRAWVVHPHDAETLDLLKDGQNRYYYGGPFAIGQRSLWGYPVVVSSAVDEGEGWLGDWSKVILFDREQATISISDSHSDFFIRNMVAILCELRAALLVTKPSSLIKVEMTAGT